MLRAQDRLAPRNHWTRRRSYFHRRTCKSDYSQAKCRGHAGAGIFPRYPRCRFPRRKPDRPLAEHSRISPAATLSARMSALSNVETGVTMSAVTNEVGQYHLLFVNPGTYRFTAEMPGFRTFVRENVLLTLGEAATLDVPMEVGSQAETVTVAAQAPLLDAEKADRGSGLDQKNLSSLPLIARVPNLMRHSGARRHLDRAQLQLARAVFEWRVLELFHQRQHLAERGIPARRRARTT